LHCIALHCIVLYCIVLYCIVLCCVVLCCVVLCCVVLCCVVLCCVVLYYNIILYYIIYNTRDAQFISLLNTQNCVNAHLCHIWTTCFNQHSGHLHGHLTLFWLLELLYFRVVHSDDTRARVEAKCNSSSRKQNSVKWRVTGWILSFPSHELSTLLHGRLKLHLLQKMYVWWQPELLKSLKISTYVTWLH
jgi:hypothetical protein